MTDRSKSDLLSELTSDIPSNVTRRVSPTNVRDTITDVVDSCYGFKTIEVGEIAAPIPMPFNAASTYYATGIILPTEDVAEWGLVHVNHGEWHLFRVHDIDVVDAAGEHVQVGDSRTNENNFDQFAEVFTEALNASAVEYIVSLGIDQNRQLMIAVVNDTVDTTVTRLEVRRLGVV